jgi:cell division protein ZapA
MIRSVSRVILIMIMEEAFFVKKRVSVTVAGQEIRLITDSDEEQLRGIASYVEEKIQEIAASSRAPISTTAVLACLNIADDLFKAREMADSLRAQIKIHIDADAKSRAELTELKREQTRRQKAESKPTA